MDDRWGWGDALDEIDEFGDDRGGSSDPSDSSTDGSVECAEDCALFESAAEHILYHIVDGGKAGQPDGISQTAAGCRLPDGLFPRPGGSRDGRFTASFLSPGSLMYFAGPDFRLRDFFGDKLEADELDLDEEMLRGIFWTGECAGCFPLSDGGPRLWWALRGACPPFGSFVDLAMQLIGSVQSLVEAASAGQRVQPAAIRAPPLCHKAAAQGFIELSFLALALEDAVGDTDALAALVDAATRLPCARRGAEVVFWEQGFSIELYMAPPPDARQSAVVPGLLFIPAADEAAVEAVRLLRRRQRSEAPPRVSQRNRRRGRKTK
jgi:hypothetical protein